MARTSPGVPLMAPSLIAAIADETLGIPVDCSSTPYVTIWLESAGTTSSGVVTIEEARVPTFLGTWAPITDVNASDVSGGLVKSVHLPPGNYRWIRTRVSTVIGGGGSLSTFVSGC